MSALCTCMAGGGRRIRADVQPHSHALAPTATCRGLSTVQRLATQGRRQPPANHCGPAEPLACQYCGTCVGMGESMNGDRNHQALWLTCRVLSLRNCGRIQQFPGTNRTLGSFWSRTELETCFPAAPSRGAATTCTPVPPPRSWAACYLSAGMNGILIMFTPHLH